MSPNARYRALISVVAEIEAPDPMAAYRLLQGLHHVALDLTPLMNGQVVHSVLNPDPIPEPEEEAPTSDQPPLGAQQEAPAQ